MKRVTAIELELVTETLADIDPTKLIQVRFRVKGDEGSHYYHSHTAIYPRDEIISWIQRWLDTDKPAPTLEPPK